LDASIRAVIAGPLAPGDSYSLEIDLEILPTATSGSLRNVAEIANMTNEQGVIVQDTDSELEDDLDSEFESGHKS